MINIFCITDCDGLKYVGASKSCVRAVLSWLVYDKKNNIKKNNSRLLNLEYCEIEVIDECEPTDKKIKLKYWIDKIDCVNERKMTFDKKKRSKELYNYRISWGGYYKSNNNLLEIDVNLFQ